MREIKFRGKRVDSGDWVYGDLLQTKPKHGDERCIIPSGCFGVNGLECVVMEMPIVEWDSLGQFTGETNGFGEEVYEGDKLSNNYETDKEVIREVRFKAGAWYMVQISGKSRMAHSLLLADYCELNYKVIGNIHDNPELLEA